MARSSMQVLSKGEIEQVHQTSLKILSARGVAKPTPEGTSPVIVHAAKGQKRRSVLKDSIDLAILCDALPEVDYVWPPVVATDMPSSRSSFYEFLLKMAYCSKHIQHGAASAEEARFRVGG